MDSIISTFHIDWKIIVAQAINFAVVFAVLYVFALKPLNKLMSERAEKIRKGVEDAKRNATVLQNTKVECDKIITKSKAEAEVIFENGKKEAEAKKNMMLETAKVEVATLIADGKRTLEAEKKKMVEDVKKEVVALALKITEKLIDKKIDTVALDEKTMKDLNNL